MLTSTPHPFARAAAITAVLSLAVAALTPSATADDPPSFTVDRYGQVASAEFPGKVTDDAQLRADVAADDSYYDSLTPAERDEFGGDPGSGAAHGLEATGFFHVENHDGRSFLVDPAGNQFFSLGLAGLAYVGDTYTDVSGREDLYESLPRDDADPLAAGWMDGGRQNYSFYVANQVRKYGSWDHLDHWNRQVERVTALGFNTAGGFSHLEDEGTRIPYIRGVDEKPDNTFGGDSFPDVFDPDYAPALDSIVEEQVSPRVDDPYLIGYTFANEIRWDRLRTQISASTVSGGSATKAAFVAFVEDNHGGDIDSFNSAWGTEFTSFDALADTSFTPTTDGAVSDVEGFTAEYLDTFYATFADAFRATDPHHMVIGDRWFSNVLNDDAMRDQLATAAGRHLDALTYNYYSWDIDKDRIAEIYEQSGGTPMILTEFHYGETSHGLTFAIRMAGSEQEKGELYRNYVEQAASTGMVVGTHWFEQFDQAATGRWHQGQDGEAGGIGIHDVTDRPYRTMLESVSAAHESIYDIADGAQGPYAYDFKPGQQERDNDQHTDIPRATTSPVVDGTLDTNWPDGPTLHLGTTELTDGVAEDGVEADYRLAWNQENLYLHATVKDPTPMLNRYHGFDIWNGDAVELFVGPNNVEEGGGIRFTDTQVILSAQPQDENGTAEYFWYNNRQDQPEIRATVVPVQGGYALEAAIPLDELGLLGDDGTVDAPRDLRFDIGFDDGNGNSRQRQFMWNGVEGNSSNRDKWGMATLRDDGADQPTFSDVDRGDQFYAEIEWLAAEGITEGYPDGTFRPLADVNRDAMAAYLYRMAGSPAVIAPRTQPFRDVAPGMEHYDAIIWAHQQGITRGWPDRTFRPTTPIDRDATAAFLYRYAGSPEVALPTRPVFTDVPASHQFAREISWLRSQNVAQGWPDGTFRPRTSTKRDAMAAFIYRIREDAGITYLSQQDE